MREKLGIKWGDFSPNISNTFSSLRYKKNFIDVTLVSNDHQQVSAHKVVLSACSGYFDTILTLNTHSHPLLCLDGINAIELNNVLDYIYNGEIMMYQQDLDRFLEIAERLQLKGLLPEMNSDKSENVEKSEYIVKNEHDYKNDYKDKSDLIAVEEKSEKLTSLATYYKTEKFDQSKPRSGGPSNAVIKRKSSIATLDGEKNNRSDNKSLINDEFENKKGTERSFFGEEKSENLFGQAVIRKKADTYQKPSFDAKTIALNIIEQENQKSSDEYETLYEVLADEDSNTDLSEKILFSGDFDDLDYQVKQEMEKIPGGYKCKRGLIYTSKNNIHMKEHIESKHVKGLAFNCDMCEYIGKTRNTVRQHKSKVHSGAKSK